EKYGDRRRTRIVPSSGEIDIEDMIAEEDTIITLTHYGYIKRMPENTYRTQKRGGRGVIGLTTRDEDFVEDLFITSTHDIILFFTNKGNVFSLRGYEIPEAGRQAKGMAIINLLNLDGDEKISAVIPISSYDPKSNLILMTKEGITKRTKLDEFKNLRKNGIIAITLRDNDELIAVKKTDGNNEVILVTEKGIAIRFEEEDVRTMGRNAMGVKAIDINQGDSVVAMDLIEDDKYLLAITENGFGKKTRLKEYRTQNRGGKGIRTYNIKEKTGDIVTGRVIGDNDEVMMITFNGTIIRLNSEDISTMGRSTQGVTLMRMVNDTVVAVAKYMEE